MLKHSHKRLHAIHFHYTIHLSPVFGGLRRTRCTALCLVFHADPCHGFGGLRRVAADLETRLPTADGLGVVLGDRRQRLPRSRSSRQCTSRLKTTTARPAKPPRQGIAFIPRKEEQGHGQRCRNQGTTESTISRDRDRRTVRQGTRRARLMQYAQVRLHSTESSRPAGTTPSTASHDHVRSAYVQRRTCARGGARGLSPPDLLPLRLPHVLRQARDDGERALPEVNLLARPCAQAGADHPASG